jgi:RNA-binding protein YhbY
MDKTKTKQNDQNESLSNEFMEELSPEESEIFLKLKSVLIDKCELLEFEAVNEDNLDEYKELINYIKHNRVMIEDDGVTVFLRREIKNKDDVKLTDKVKILYKRNEGREKAFTKKIKVRKNDSDSQKEFTRAAVAASLANVDVDGKSVILSTENISSKHIHHKDYMLMLNCYSFFRN